MSYLFMCEYLWRRCPRWNFISFFHVILFNFAAIIPHPSAWFPLNGTHQTSEIEHRTSSGLITGKRVLLSLGPDGTKEGSYFFEALQAQASSIAFPDRNSKLDINFSITILFWLYTYNNIAETKFLQYKGMELFVNRKELKLTFPKRSSPNSDNQLTGTLAERGWTFVGVSYNGTTAEAKLYINGNMMSSKTPTANFIGPRLLTLGGNKFKGKITQLMLFNLTLTQEQITGIKGRMKLPGDTESHIYTIKMIRHFKRILFWMKDVHVCMALTFLSLYIISNTFIR